MYTLICGECVNILTVIQTYFYTICRTIPKKTGKLINITIDTNTTAEISSTI